MNNPKLPITEVDSSDPGDDVQLRFRFQSTYAAIVALTTLHDNPLVKEIYCELHEDILVKYKDGFFEGIQVKTRAPHLNNFCFSDSQIKHAICKFVKLELKFPKKFKAFRLVSNIGFLEKKGDDLNEVISIAKSENPDALKNNRTTYGKVVKEICKEVGCVEYQVIDVLSKIILRPAFSHLNDIKTKLVYELNKLSLLKGMTLGQLTKIADSVSHFCFEASSKGGEGLFESFVLGRNIDDLETANEIENKRIDSVKLLPIFSNAKESPISIFLKDDRSLFSKSSSGKKIELKMDAGGIDFDNISLIKDHKYSFESFMSTWIHRYGIEEATKRYNQIQLIIYNECKEVYDEKESTDNLFGKEMLKEIRNRLRRRIVEDREKYFDCHYEHLLGMTGVLTEECLVWWSEKFKID